MKKFTCLLLSTLMLIFSSNIFAYEEKADIYSSEKQPTTTEMEEMIKMIKPRLDIDTDCTEFSWNYNSGNYSIAPSWYFSWSDKDYSKEYSVTADTDGNIINYYYYSNKPRTYKLQEYLIEELQAKAAEYVNDLLPDISGTLKLTKAYCNSFYSRNYQYIFDRYENSVPFSTDRVVVSLDSSTGELKNLSVSYNRVDKIPDTEGIISLEKAKEIISEKQKMLLSYRTKQTEKADGTFGTTAFLVYSPELSYISADAKTGEIYLKRSTLNINSSASDKLMGSNMFDAAEREESAKGEYILTEEEKAQLEVLNALISKEDALKSVVSNKELAIGEDMTTVEANLNKSYRDDCDYVWSVVIKTPDGDSFDNKDYYTYAYAEVNAHNGALVSFSSNPADYMYYESNSIAYPEVKLSKDESEQIAKNFLERQNVDRFEKTRLSYYNPVRVLKYNVSDDGIRTPVYGSYNFNYVRVNEGIDYTYNNIYCTVDGVTGKITSYGYNWDDTVEFESPKDAISAQEAFKIYASQPGFGLNYELYSVVEYNKYLLDEKGKNTYTDYDELYEYLPEARLVYSAYSTGTNLVRALTGELCNYSGDTYTENEISYSYSDIDGHWAERTIRLFADLGIGFEGESFKPDEKITDEEFKDVMSKCSFYTDSISANRLEAVKIIVDVLGYKKLASINEIFKESFNDITSSEATGYIAIAKGLGIINGDKNKFRPDDTLTRAEALTLIANALNARS